MRPRPLQPPFEASVVGVSFAPHYPDILHQLQMHQLEADALGEPLRAVLVRFPDNPLDANAIEVHVPALGYDGRIGHLPRPLAARLAPELDADIQWSAEVHWVRVDPEHPDRPGITINIKRISRKEP